MQSEAEGQRALFHDILGNPFRPVRIDRSSLPEEVILLGRTIYIEQLFNRLPQLAEALEQAGYTNKEVLGHCRGPGPHVRGCWVVDLLLGKA